MSLRDAGPAAASAEGGVVVDPNSPAALGALFDPEGSRPQSKVKSYSLITDGGAGDAQIRKELEAAHNRFLYCYWKLISIRPDYVGSLKLRFYIDKGKATLIREAGGSLTEPTFIACVKDQLEAIRFGDLSAGVEYAINLEATGK